jgi:histidine phosphotransfer protein HptB
MDKNELDLNTISSLYEAIGGEAGDIIELFINSVPDSMQELKQSCDDKEFKIIERIGHSLKSSAGSFGLLGIADIAEAIENQAIKESISEIEQLVQKLEATSEKIIPVLQQQVQLRRKE